MGKRAEERVKEPDTAENPALAAYMEKSIPPIPSIPLQVRQNMLN